MTKKTSRKSFLKFVGIAGFSTVAAKVLPACNSSTDKKNSIPKDKVKDWRSDPEWQKMKYGEWGGPGVRIGPGPMDDVLLKNYAPRSSVVTQKTFVPKAKYPVIDAHSHNYPGETSSPSMVLAQWVEAQKKVGVDKTVILTMAAGEEFDQAVELYRPYSDRFLLYCGVLKKDINKPDYPERAIAELERCYRKGARGIGELHDKGYGLTGDHKLPSEERLHPDDKRLDGFWEKAAALNMPVSLHLSDHPSAWTPPDVFQERTPVFQQYNQYGGSGMSYEELLGILPRLLKKHSNTIFILCHLANLGNDLGRLSKLLDNHQNLYVDLSARDYELGRQPRGAPKFLDKYHDRVLFGTDMPGEEGMYQSYWRLLESADEDIKGRVWWRYYGLDLSDHVLKSLYLDNAKRVMNINLISV